MTVALARKSPAVRARDTAERRAISHQVALAAGDLCLLILATWVAARGFGEPETTVTSSWSLFDRATPYFVLGFILPVHFLALVAFNTYSSKNLGSRREVLRALSATSTTAGIMGILAFASNLSLPGSIPLAYLGFSAAALFTWHVGSALSVRSLRRHGSYLDQSVVVGSHDEVADVIRVLDREAWAGYRVIGVVLTDEVEAMSVLGIPVVGSPMSLTRDIARLQVTTVILTSGGGRSGEGYQRLLWQLGDSGVEVLVAPGYINLSGSRMDVHSVAGMPLLRLQLPQFSGAQAAVKRVIGLLLALVILVFAAPAMALVAAGIKLTSRGPVIFRQTRVGLNGVEFTCFKFRTMVTNADELVETLSELDEGNGLNFKIRNDPRVTPIGKWLRRFSLDEVPQLFNVVRGEMALVGPRPPLPREVEMYNEALQRRLLVRPGMTGLWQVSGRSDLTLEESTRLDLYYVDNWSVGFDAEIVLRTIKAVITGKGAY